MGHATCVRYSTQGGWTHVWSYLSCWESSLLAGMANSTVDQEYQNPPNGGFLYWERKYSKIIVINPSICCDSVALWTDGIPCTVDWHEISVEQWERSQWSWALKSSTCDYTSSSDFLETVLEESHVPELQKPWCSHWRKLWRVFVLVFCLLLKWKIRISWVCEI